MEFQITRESKWRILYMRICFSIGIGTAAIMVTSVFYFPQMWWVIASFMLIWIFFLDIGPGLYLYKEYMQYNADSLFKVDIESKLIVYRRANAELITATFNEIKEIIVYIPPNNYRGTITFIAMEDFSYARFELKNGKEFYVTCLMIPKLKDFVQKNFSGVPIDFHRWWIFPSIRLVNYCRRK